MNTMTRQRAAAALSLAAGGGDLVTGCLLVLAPRWTLARMGVPPVAAPVFLQFVGVFVACVGAGYFFGLLAWRGDGGRRLRFVWEWTILFRAAAGGFVAAQIAAGALPWPWASVPAVDWVWALAQALGLRAGFFQEIQR